MSSALQTTIDRAWENRAEISAATATPELRDAVEQAIAALDRGELRVAEKIDALPLPSCAR